MYVRMGEKTKAKHCMQAVALVFGYIDVAGIMANPSSSPQEGTSAAAQKLLEDLCSLATGNSQILYECTWLSQAWNNKLTLRLSQHHFCAGATPVWLSTPPLPRGFVLELLEFVLAHFAAVFKVLPAFQQSLVIRVSQLLLLQLREGTDASNTAAHNLKSVLRGVRTLLKGFHAQLGSQCGVFLEALVQGMLLPMIGM